MRSRDVRLERLRAAEREYLVAVIALRSFGERLQADPSLLAAHRLRLRDYRQLCDHLAGTYVIRLFAEFETGLREVWSQAYGRTTHPRTVELLAALTALCSVPQAWHAQADEVRRFRNSLVHEEESAAPVLALEEVRSRLVRFFSRLPEQW
jgi:hypothetical protein